MSDVIRLRGVAATARHGVLPHEKEHPQPFLVDVDLEADLSRAGRTDDLTESISYADIAARVVAVLEGESVDLVEALAERIADECLAEPLAEAVTVTVHKPHAPVGVPFADVAVTVRRERAARVVVALGGNLGSPAERLADAVRRIAAIDGLDVRALSPLVETDPVGGPEQGVYLNAVLVATTRLAPATLLDRLHDVEAVHGRVRDVRWGPRTLDLDIVSYADDRLGGLVASDDPELTLPHPRAHERAFVLVPWLLADPADAWARAAWAVLSGGSNGSGGHGGPGDSGDEPEVTRAAAAGFGVRPGPDWPAAVREFAMVTTW